VGAAVPGYLELKQLHPHPPNRAASPGRHKSLGKKARPSVAIAIPWCVHKFNRAFYISTSTSKLEDNAQFA